MLRQVSFAALVLCVVGVAPARAEMLEETGTFGGVQVTYEVVLPTGYTPTEAYPVVLVFTGGSQSVAGARRTPESDWQQEAERRGYIVISPAAPDGQLFFRGGSRVFPEFLDFILTTYNPAGKLHVAGHSNGGLSAFYVAMQYPQYFSTVTGYPGLLNGPDGPDPSPLGSMCIFMHVGENDHGWLELMSEQAETLDAQGFRVRFTIEPNQEHRIRAAEVDLSPRLFDEIESCEQPASRGMAPTAGATP